jgi:hypothetical protein
VIKLEDIKELMLEGLEAQNFKERKSILKFSPFVVS